MGKWRRRIWSVLFWLFLVLFVFSSWHLYQYYREYSRAEAEYTQLQQLVRTEETTENKIQEKNRKSKKKQTELVEEEALRNMNSDYCAWIRIPDTPIDYPVVQGKDNEYYLHHTFTGQENASGAIFMSVDNDGFEDKNTVLFGHNMRNQTMFGSLKNYQDEGYWRKHPIIEIIREGKRYRYKIFFAASVSLTEVDKMLSKDYDVQSTKCRKRKILTLSTCSTNENDRFLVRAALLTKAEK
ncbi:MAG: class B sortase [Lachnospiraceae bacterium]